MQRQIFHTLLTITLLTMTSCKTDEIDSLMDAALVRNISTGECIWDDATHCAFTDLVEYEGAYYCTFREASVHLPQSESDYGQIRILRSVDGNTWDDFGILAEDGSDLRDPMLCVTPDNRLMLTYGRYKINHDAPYPWTRVKFLTPEEISTGRINNYGVLDINIEHNDELSTFWIWRVKWVGDTAFGIAYRSGQLPLLVKSGNGIDFELVAVLDALGNEADLEPLADGGMLIVMRSQDGEKGYVGLSQPPFTQWNWSRTSLIIHCPKIITIGSEIFIAGRWNKGTTIFRYISDNRDITPYVVIPQYGDFAYPGIIYSEGQIWLSYYGSLGEKSAIFLSKIDYLVNI